MFLARSIEHIKRNNFFSDSLAWTLKGCRKIIFAKMSNKTSFRAKNSGIHQKWVVARQKTFSKHSTHQGGQLFLWQFSLKTALKGVNYSFLSKLPKRRIFRPKMTSYVKNETSHGKIFFQIIAHIKGNNFSTDSLAWKRH